MILILALIFSFAGLVFYPVIGDLFCSGLSYGIAAVFLFYYAVKNEINKKDRL